LKARKRKRKRKINLNKFPETRAIFVSDSLCVSKGLHDRVCFVKICCKNKANKWEKKGSDLKKKKPSRMISSSFPLLAVRSPPLKLVKYLAEAELSGSIIIIFIFKDSLPYLQRQ